MISSYIAPMYIVNVLLGISFDIVHVICSPLYLSYCSIWF